MYTPLWKAPNFLHDENMDDNHCVFTIYTKIHYLVDVGGFTGYGLEVVSFPDPNNPSALRTDKRIHGKRGLYGN